VNWFTQGGLFLARVLDHTPFGTNEQRPLELRCCTQILEVFLHLDLDILTIKIVAKLKRQFLNSLRQRREKSDLACFELAFASKRYDISWLPSEVARFAIARAPIPAVSRCENTLVLRRGLAC